MSIYGAKAEIPNQCRRGHVINEENTYVRPDGRRDCRVCRKIRDSRRYIERKKPQGSHHEGY